MKMIASEQKKPHLPQLMDNKWVYNPIKLLEHFHILRVRSYDSLYLVHLQWRQTRCTHEKKKKKETKKRETVILVRNFEILIHRAFGFKWNAKNKTISTNEWKIHQKLKCTFLLAKKEESTSIIIKFCSANIYKSGNLNSIDMHFKSMPNEFWPSPPHRCIQTHTSRYK